jgi:hypothetical protein
VKTITYPRFPSLVIAEAEGDARSLNQEVWKHEKDARSQGMPLVIEIYARSVLASRRLSEWWQSGDQLMQDTLSGVYLLRVDLQRFGPEAILKLTPYAVVGAPLFVGWNQIGQVCSRTQFNELTREAFALPLSAFVEDVLARREHSLNPMPNLGNAERTREALALKRASLALLGAARTPLTSNEASTLAVVAVKNLAGDTPGRGEELGEALLADTSSQPEDTRVRIGEGDPSQGPQQLDALLAGARANFGMLEDRVGTKLRMTLDDLRHIDDYIATMSELDSDIFARELGAVLGVYLGDTIRQRVQADWMLTGTSLSSSNLELRGTVLGEQKRVQPMEWVIEILSDTTRSLYGQALGWCRVY